ncbi:N-succinyldiaminopimelate aminotransferase [Friedmanniella endophytica]|uniref:N-succinyldiaminopimelate aminotransferase n=1 Tax=Microlunatus kandeliicorticis TaxID=1759536 RepID=A0A7W3P4H7_9ACTN|nr:pyridoxal phosphate-dependent aminotransferase [Microlunatus kandeliicorticis]MBA8792825.1 N-succinyldiaminopimelate aminotransferase [Microlunatus kandeliicorticis]
MTITGQPGPARGPVPAPARAAGTPPLAERMRAFGTTIFAEMSALATRTGSINLGQGFPDTDGPEEVLAAARQAISDGHNQYPPGRGIPELRQAIAADRERRRGQRFDPETEVLVTAGATEAITAAVLALCEAGDEVIALEPTYDSYAASIALAGARLVPVRLEPPDFGVDLDRLAAAITPRTRLLLINTPHNPTGRVLDEQELAGIARLAVAHDLLVITDEVYEHLVYDGEHLPLARFPGMAERTITVSSAGKTFAVTGWKIGWACARPELITAITTTKQFLTYVNGAPFQWAVATGLGLPDSVITTIRDDLRAGRDLLADGLRAAGLEPFRCQGTYFLTVDVARLGFDDGLDFCRRLPELCGVVAVPSRVFYTDPGPAASFVRFAFCKRPAVLSAAAERLATLSPR